MTMHAITYESISSNIANVRVDGAHVEVSWTCPVSGRAMGSSTASMSADPSLVTRVGASVQRSIASELIYGAARFLSSLVGGAAGRVLSNAAYTAAGDLNTRATAGADYSEASRRAAVVLAFDSVRSTFAWDDASRQFVAKPTSAA